MHRVDAFGHDNNFFTAGDPNIAKPATRLGADWHNAAQEELVAAVLASGQSLVKADNTQLTKAIRRLGTNKSDIANLVINPTFSLWQRGTTFNFTAAAPSGYTADRFRFDLGTGGTPTATVSRQVEALPVLPATVAEPRSTRDILQVAQTGAATTSGSRIGTRLPLLIQTSNQSLVFSVLLKAGSAMSVVPQVRQSFGSGGSADVTQQGAAFAVGTTFQRFSFVVTPAAIDSTKTLGAGDYIAFELVLPTSATFTLQAKAWDVKFGSEFTYFQMEEFALNYYKCARFYQKTCPLDVTPGTAGVSSGAISCHSSGTDVPGMNFRFPVPMRTQPTVRIWCPGSGTFNRIRKNGVEDSTTDIVSVSGNLFQHTSQFSSGFVTIRGPDPGGTVALAHFDVNAEL